MATAQHAEQAVWLWALQLQGMTLTQMRELTKAPEWQGGLGLELSEATISRRLREHGERKVTFIGELRDSWVAIELERLEGVHAAYLRMAQPLDDDGNPRGAGVIDLGLKGMLATSRERRALMGTNAPTKIEAKVEALGNDGIGLEGMFADAQRRDNEIRLRSR